MKDSIKVLKTTFALLRRYPEMLIPLLFSWCVFASGILYSSFSFNWQIYTRAEQYGVVYGFVALLSLVTIFACSIIVKMIYDIETNSGRPNLFAAFIDCTRNFLRTIPIALLWSVLWFALLVIASAFGKNRGNSRDTTFNMENAARVLTGSGSFSFSRAFVRALEKAVRMAVLLCLPAIIWERHNTTGAIKRALSILRNQKTGIIVDYVTSYLAIALMAVPIVILLVLDKKLNLHVPDTVWLGVIVYSAMLWSLGLFIEQVMMATQYMRFLKWERAAQEAEAQGKPVPVIADIPLPSVLDDVADLAPLLPN